MRFPRADLGFQFRPHPLGIESLPLVGGSCGGLKFFEPTTKCLKFVSVALFDLCGSLRQFGLETSPDSLLIVVMLLEEQAEGFFRTKLGNAGEILNTEAIQNLGSFQLASA